MADPVNTVTVIDLRIPFWRLVAFLLKLAFAAIPAAIIFAFLMIMIAGLLQAIGLGIMTWNWQGLRI